MNQRLSIIEYAKASGYSPKHISEQIRLGKLPAKKIDGRWMILASALKVKQ